MAVTAQGSTDFAKTAYDLMAYFALRPQLYFDAVADVKPTNQSQAGSAVQFTITNDLAFATTPLNESTDLTPVALSDSTVSLTLAEYGNAVTTTALARGTSFLDLDPVAANIVGFNAGGSIDTLARNILQAGTNVNYAVGNGTNVAAARNQVSPANTLVASDVRQVRAQLLRNNVPQIGSYYMAFIHPDVSFDLRGQTGAATWNEPHAYSQPDNIWTGELGSFSGFRFVETPRAPIFADAGSSTTFTDVYRTLFLGRQALAKAYSYVDGNGAFPMVVPGPITDSLRRLVPIGWYWLGVYGIFRQASLYGVESASSIGKNGASGSN
jgi:N4-gp56 family major capsid protein